MSHSSAEALAAAAFAPPQAPPFAPGPASAPDEFERAASLPSPRAEHLLAPAAGGSALTAPIATAPIGAAPIATAPSAHPAPSAPPLPSNAFAHLQPNTGPSGVALDMTQPHPPAQAVALSSAPPAMAWPLPSAANPWTDAPNTVAGALPQPVPTAPRKGIQAVEIVVLTLAVLASATLVLQRNGQLQRWMGHGPSSAYSKFETSVFGEPSINTVRGVEQFLVQLKAERRPAVPTRSGKNKTK